MRLVLFHCCCLHLLLALMSLDKILTSSDVESECVKYQPVSACDYCSSSAPYRTGLVWAKRVHHGRDNWGWGGVVKASHRDVVCGRHSRD